jgi:hypothetical protein
VQPTKTSNGPSVDVGGRLLDAPLPFGVEWVDRETGPELVATLAQLGHTTRHFSDFWPMAHRKLFSNQYQ